MFLHDSMSNSGCGCSSRSGNAECQNFGPFLAVDAACIRQEAKPYTGGSMIPFSSGTVPSVLVSLLTGLVGTSSLVGFGSSITGISIVNNTITLPALNEAFSVPRDGNMTALSASFTETLGITVLGTATINARIYRAPAGSNVFTATDATVNLTPMTGPITAGTTVSGSASFPAIPVAAGDRLVMVFSVTASGAGLPTLVNTVTGAASAGLYIES